MPRNGADVHIPKIKFENNQYFVEAKDECKSIITITGSHKWNFKTVLGIDNSIEQTNIFVKEGVSVTVHASHEGFRPVIGIDHNKLAQGEPDPTILGEVMLSNTILE